MIRIQANNNLKKDDVEYVRAAIIYTLSYLVPAPKLRRKSLVVSIKAPTEAQTNSDLKGLSWYVKNKKKGCIWISAAVISKKIKSRWLRLKPIFEILVHELVHISQMFQNINNDFVDWTNEELYWNSPSEIEAYGREKWLLMRLERLFNNGLCL